MQWFKANKQSEARITPPVDNRSAFSPLPPIKRGLSFLMLHRLSRCFPSRPWSESVSNPFWSLQRFKRRVLKQCYRWQSGQMALSRYSFL